MSKYAKFSHLIIKVRTLALKSLQNLPISSTVFHLFSKRVMFDEKAYPLWVQGVVNQNQERFCRFKRYERLS